MRNRMFVLMLMVVAGLPAGVSGQERVLNDMERFIAEQGPLVYFENYYLSGLTSANNKFIYTKLRRVSAGDESRYYLLFSARDKYISTSAVLSEADLKLLLTNLLQMQAAVTTANDDSDYRESRFITKDWFQIGCAYNANEKRLIWSLTLSRDEDAVYFFHTPEALERNLTAALQKIEALKSSE